MTDSSKTRRRSATYTLDVLASKMFPDRRFSTAPTSPIAPPVGSSPRPQLDRLARSLPDASDIVDELIARDIRLNLGGSIHDPTDPVGRLLFNVLALVAEFEFRPHPHANP